MPESPETRLERAIHELQVATVANTASQKDSTQAIKDLRTEIATTYVRRDVLDPTLASINEKVNAHSEWITWATRIVIALVITAVIGYVFSQGGGR